MKGERGKQKGTDSEKEGRVPGDPFDAMCSLRDMQKCSPLCIMTAAGRSEMREAERN